MKFLADMKSTEPIPAIHGGPHVLVPFAVEDGGRLEAYAQSILRAMATVALEKGKRPPLKFSSFEILNNNTHYFAWLCPVLSCRFLLPGSLRVRTICFIDPEHYFTSGTVRYSNVRILRPLNF
jgi:hypothetical protein